MIIRSICMKNFRGFREKTIDFQDKPVVLLSAANGMGKTTTVDAIEWCLTGNIGRLKTAFEHRSTNDQERRKNAKGILKNRKAGGGEKVKVTLTLFDGEKERVLCRVQKKDDLDPEASTLTLDGSEEEAGAFFREYVGESFYNFHFCDIQKSFSVQSTKRKDLNAFFREFITNYDAERKIGENLGVFAEDVLRYIEDKEREKVPQPTIDTLRKQIAEMHRISDRISYPEILFYPEENPGIAGLRKEELLAQREVLRSCGFQAAQEALDMLVTHETAKRQQAALREIVSHWQTRGESIQRALDVGFPNRTDAVTSREKRLRELKKLALTKDTILQNSEALIALGNPGFTRPDFEDDRNQILEKEKSVQALSAEIDLLTKNNKMLDLLTSLYAHKQVVVEYRDHALAENGSVRCPVCGSESFGYMDAEAVLGEAREYSRRNGETAAAKAADRASMQAAIDELYQKILRRAEQTVNAEKVKLAAEIRELTDLKAVVQPYFDAAAKLQMSPLKIGIGELTAEKAGELLAAAEGNLLAEAEVQQATAAYRQILTVLGYRFEQETLQQTHAKVQPLAAGLRTVSNFSYDLLVAKLNAIDSILADQTLLDRKQELDACCRKNQELDAEIQKLQDLHKTATERAAEIRATVEGLSKDEYEKVGPALEKFYNKLARFNAAEGIRIKLENEGISLVDGKGKNIVNVLSNGQISVFMLAYFFAGINVRNDSEKMKIYFIDDLTACMDDVNMLAFMDLLKYQMSSKATMDQLFFITCDDRISNLLKYKLTGRGIELCELGEEDIAEKAG